MNNVVLMTNYIMGRMRRVYFMSLPETRHDYKKSRICYTVGDSAAQTIVQLAGGTFLVALLVALGIAHMYIDEEVREQAKRKLAGILGKKRVGCID